VLNLNVDNNKKLLRNELEKIREMLVEAAVIKMNKHEEY